MRQLILTKISPDINHTTIQCTPQESTENIAQTFHPKCVKQLAQHMATKEVLFKTSVIMQKQEHVA